MRIIFTAGGSIYPLGHCCGSLFEQVDETLLIVVYNAAGFANKIAFRSAHFAVGTVTGRVDWGMRDLSCVASRDPGLQKK